MDMIYRRLGRSGIKVSVLSFGSWVTFHNQVDVTSAVDMMKAAYEAGVNFFGLVLSLFFEVSAHSTFSIHFNALRANLAASTRNPPALSGSYEKSC